MSTVSLRIVVLKAGCEIPFDNALDKTLITRTGRLTLHEEKEAIYAEHLKFKDRYGSEGVWIPVENCALWVEGPAEGVKPVEQPKPVEKPAPASLLGDSGTVKFVKDPKTGQMGVKKPDGTIDPITAKLT